MVRRSKFPYPASSAEPSSAEPAAPTSKVSVDALFQFARQHEDQLPAQPDHLVTPVRSDLQRQKNKGNKIDLNRLFKKSEPLPTEHKALEAAVRKSSGVSEDAVDAEDGAKRTSKWRKRRSLAHESNVEKDGAGSGTEPDIITRLFAGAAEKAKALDADVVSKDSRSASCSDESTCMGSTTDEDSQAMANSNGYDGWPYYGAAFDAVNIDLLTAALSEIWTMRLQKAFDLVASLPTGGDPTVLGKWHLRIAQSSEPEAEAWRIMRMSMELCSQGYISNSHPSPPVEASGKSSSSVAAAGTESDASEAEQPKPVWQKAEREFAAAFSAATPEVRQQMLRDRLQEEVQQIEPDLAGKITGKLLERDSLALLDLLASPELLRRQIDEAVTAMRRADAADTAAESTDLSTAATPRSSEDEAGEADDSVRRRQA
eukprot:TRINITY_DN113809_c0_g1_i1.p1 TRINITY_DN113809_c0_g1~~TRINITY_DN113809_c0_g1_i1.p1  ORF type:complete len:429 (+),score=109.29 TRINITY_DN113809_c0_g1_i1:170-1456(+)